MLYTRAFFIPLTMEKIYRLFLESNGVCTDSRKLENNQLYFALRGENFDGHSFVEEANKKGAIGCIIDDATYANEKNILVDDVLTCLQQLANFHRNKLNIPILALTGSNGKTTSKKIISQVLAKKFKVTATRGNLNNHIGVPLSLLEMNSATEFGVIEMGANHQKEIEFLCSIAEPNYGYITNFGKAHLEGFGGIEGVIKGKSELYNHIIKTNGLLFVNGDDPVQLEKSANARCVFFGSKKTEKNTHVIELAAKSPTLKIKAGNQLIQTSLIGAYNFSNIAAGIAIGLHFGIDIEEIKNSLENFEPEGNRSQVMKTEKNNVLLDAYNANPTSMEAAIKNFDELEHPAKILILGDMFEIGETALEEHKKIAEIAEKSTAEKVYLCGEFFSSAVHENEKITLSTDTLSLLEALKKEELQHKFILLKGSRGMAMERLLKAL